MKNIFLVDADDTILDFHGASELALKNAFVQSGVIWKEEYLSIFRDVNNRLWEALERREITRDALMEQRFVLLMQRLRLPQVDGMAFNKLFLQTLANTPIYMPGAQSFLQTLGTMGRVYIVTNGTAWIQKSRFTISKLYDYAQDVFISDEIGVNKPAKGYTDYVLAHIDHFDKKRSVWIGDSLSADIKAANEADITSIWFNPDGKVAADIVPDFEARSFDEVLQILQKL